MSLLHPAGLLTRIEQHIAFWEATNTAWASQSEIATHQTVLSQWRKLEADIVAELEAEQKTAPESPTERG